MGAGRPLTTCRMRAGRSLTSCRSERHAPSLVAGQSRTLPHYRSLPGSASPTTPKARPGTPTHHTVVIHTAVVTDKK
ncbi:hypothetical protein GCM10009589_24230 [Arthrobacter pascens]|uniref:hypothetical protein n=1 Tax=Arthrobacter pascens TaxID=1677 RepID=UPI0031D24441